MKLTLERSDLIQGLSKVAGIVSKKTTLPILSFVRMDVKGESLYVTATDLDMQATAKTTVDADGSESFCVEAQTLLGIARKMRDGAMVSMETDDSTVQIKSGRSKFVLPILPVDDFPAVTSGDLPEPFAVPSESMNGLLSTVSFAMSSEETRYYLCGIHMHVDDSGIHAVATDGHRLAHAFMDSASVAEHLPPIIIPAKTAQELKKLLANHDGNVSLSFSESKMRAVVGDVVLISKLIDGTFPDYQRVIPAYNDQQLVVSKADLVGAVQRVSSISSINSAVRVDLSTDTVTLSSRGDSGESTESVDCAFSDDGFSIGFNGKYLLEVLAQVKSDQATIMLNDGNSPALIIDDSNEKSVFVLMPMRI